MSMLSAQAIPLWTSRTVVGAATGLPTGVLSRRVEAAEPTGR